MRPIHWNTCRFAGQRCYLPGAFLGPRARQSSVYSHQTGDRWECWHIPLTGDGRCSCLICNECRKRRKNQSYEDAGVLVRLVAQAILFTTVLFSLLYACRSEFSSLDRQWGVSSPWMGTPCGKCSWLHKINKDTHLSPRGLTVDNFNQSCNQTMWSERLPAGLRDMGTWPHVPFYSSCIQTHWPLPKHTHIHTHLLNLNDTLTVKIVHL